MSDIEAELATVRAELDALIHDNERCMTMGNEYMREAEAIKADRDSWRRVAERLETELAAMRRERETAQGAWAYLDENGDIISIRVDDSVVNAIESKVMRVILLRVSEPRPDEVGRHE